ncbi:tyrosine-type recombinase/integrase [Microbacterium sp. NPDC077663]|uniref:tyrosine-type recombinase/integrase n=1 Tax=Microbacterium sp. NPDC077663 TaxID=3364189 RepID=UPI0037C8D7C2
MARSKGAGSVEVYKNGYRIRWTDQSGTRRSKVLRGVTKRQAEAHLREVQSGLHDEPMPASPVRFEAFAKEYLAARERLITVGTYRNWVSLLNTTLLPAFGTLTLDQLTQRKVDLWWARAGLKPVLRRNAYFTLRSMMKLAVRWGYLPAWTVEIENAGKDVARPRPTFEMHHVDAVLAHLNPFYRAAVEVLLAGHVRLGELVALDAQDYDRRTGRLSVTKQLTKEGLVTDTKTRQHKTVLLLERGRLALDALPVRISGPLFAGERSARITRNGLRNAWIKATNEAGITDFRLHDLRHVGLSLVVEEAGVIVAQERAGHASPVSTRRYLHTPDRVHEEAVERIDALVRRIS